MNAQVIRAFVRSCVRASNPSFPVSVCRLCVACGSLVGHLCWSCKLINSLWGRVWLLPSSMPNSAIIAHAMVSVSNIRHDAGQALRAAFPIMLGYVAIGIPCGILSSSIGMTVPQVLVMSVLFYSGAGQFMIPNMWMAGAPMASIIASVSLVNTRQMLYSAAFAPVCRTANKLAAFLFAASVTDESYGVNEAKFQEGGWSVLKAALVNAFSNSSWSISNVVGVLVGDAVSIPLAVAAFAMTSIFICLLIDQKFTPANTVAIVAAFAGVVLCKCVGLTGPAILIGALCGVAAAMAFTVLRSGRKAR